MGDDPGAATSFALIFRRYISNLAFEVTEADLKVRSYLPSSLSSPPLCSPPPAAPLPSSLSSPLLSSYPSPLSRDLGGGSSAKPVVPSCLLIASSLQELFSDYNYQKCYMNYDGSGRSTGKATVVFGDRGEALKAQKRYANMALDGLVMKLDLVEGPPSGKAGAMQLSSGLMCAPLLSSSSPLLAPPPPPLYFSLVSVIFLPPCSSLIPDTGSSIVPDGRSRTLRLSSPPPPLSLSLDQ